MASKSIGKRTVKKRRVQRQREVSLFNIGDDFNDSFNDDLAFSPIDDGFPSPARTTRDLTTVAITLPLVGVTTSLISTL